MRVIITSTDCYRGNASHSNSTQHQIVLEEVIIDELTRKTAFIDFVNHPADADRGQEVIYQQEISDEQYEQIKALQEKFAKQMKGLDFPSLYGSMPYYFEDTLKSVKGLGAEKKQIEKLYEEAQTALQVLESKAYPFKKAIKDAYCKEVYEVINPKIEDWDGHKDQFAYFQTIFW